MKRVLPAIGLMLGALLLARSVVAQRPGRGGPGMGGGFPPLPIVAALDADGDGTLSAKEIDNAAAALRTLDKNKDGKLSREEYLPAFRARGPGGEGGPGGGGSPAELVARMMTFDRNGDGKLSKDELPERMQNLMERADTNKDGFVDKDELTRLAQQQGGRGRGGFGPGPGQGPGEGRGGFPRRGGGDGGRGPGEGRDQD